jgi:hypothetical protein
VARPVWEQVTDISTLLQDMKKKFEESENPEEEEGGEPEL